MGNILTGDSATFTELKWDTEFFGVTSAKAVLYEPLTLSKWNGLKSKFNEYEFVSIENRNSNPINAQLIGKDTSAFLADVNIQFEKKLIGQLETSKNVTIHQALERNEEILKIADFKFSKFTEDLELAKRNGNQVYYHWLLNSFEKSNKYFALSKDENGIVDGFLLHSYNDQDCLIELIAVSPNVKKSGIGTSLFKTIEISAQNRGCNIIKVGTQVRNMRAINFYNKVGCKQVGCHQVYHLWNAVGGYK